MDESLVKRSPDEGINLNSDHVQGVGARHKGPGAQLGGGGYLDNCTNSEILEKKSRDPRLDELDAVGINGFWRSLAQDIGYENFLVVWERLSDRADEGTDKHRVYIPQFSQFSRYQRNRLIQSLSKQGADEALIKSRISSSLGECISTAHIRRLVRTE